MPPGVPFENHYNQYSNLKRKTLIFSLIFKVCEDTTPFPEPNEVLIEVKSAGLNFFDIYICHGLGAEGHPPSLLGLECAGIVRLIGNDVSTVRVSLLIVLFPPRNI